MIVHCGARLLPLRRSHYSVVVQVERVKACQSLRFELLQGKLLSSAELAVDQPFHAASSTLAAAATPRELLSGLLGLGASDDAIVIGIEHLEYPVSTLLCLSARLIAHPAAAALFGGRSRGNAGWRRSCRLC